MVYFESENTLKGGSSEVSEEEFGEQETDEFAGQRNENDEQELSIPDLVRSYSRPESQKVTVQISDIEIDQDVYPRLSLKEKYNPLEDTDENERPSPLVATIEGEEGIVLVDGRKSILAAKAEGKTEISVVLIEVKSWAEGFAIALYENSRHGEPLTRKEKVLAAKRLFNAGMPQERIGKCLGVNQSTVSRWLYGRAPTQRSQAAEANTRNDAPPSQPVAIDPEKLRVLTPGYLILDEAFDSTSPEWKTLLIARLGTYLQELNGCVNGEQRTIGVTVEEETQPEQ